MSTVSISPSQQEALTPGGLAVLTTIHADGRPQLSTVSYTFSPATGLVRISITSDRIKYRNLLRDPRAALHVQRGHAYVVVEGTVELSQPAQEAHDATVEELIDIYRSIAGEHPDWDDYRRAMVEDRRVALTLRPTRVHGNA